ncbi:MAG: hypothetical protein WCA46_06200 [Actinocatenispora sp.]
MSDRELTPLRVVGLSARSWDSLRRTAERLADHLDEHPSYELGDLVATLARGRQHFPVRLAVLARDLSGLAGTLRAAVRPGDRPDNVVVATVRSERRYVMVLADPDAGPDLVAEPDADGDAFVRWQVDAARQLTAWGPAPDEILGVGLGVRSRELLLGPDDRSVADGTPAADGVLALVLGSRATSPPGTLPDTPVSEVVELRPDPTTDDAVAGTVARLWCAGLDMDLTLGLPGRRVHLPGTAFDRPGDDADSRPVTAAYRYRDNRPLTALQQRLLFHDLVRTSACTEHYVAAAVRLAGVDLDTLHKAVTAVQSEHGELRTVFWQSPERWMSGLRAEPGVEVEIRAELLDDGGPDDDEVVRRLMAEPVPLVERVPLRIFWVPDGDGHGLLAFVAYRGVIDRDSLAELVAATVRDGPVECPPDAGHSAQGVRTYGMD